MKAQLIRLLLGMLISSQSVGGTASNVQGVNEIVYQIEQGVSTEDIYTQLKAQGISVNDANQSYLEYLYENNIDSVYEITKKPSNAIQQVTEVIESDGSISYEKIPSVEIVNTETAEATTLEAGGVVGAISNGLMIGAILADLGLTSYGKYLYETDEAFRDTYKRVNDYTTYSSGARYMDNFNPETGEFVGIDMKNPENMSTATVLRAIASDTYETYAQKIRAFINKDAYENILKNIYEEGVLSSSEVVVDDNAPKPTTSSRYNFVSSSLSTGSVVSTINKLFSTTPFTIKKPINISTSVASANQYFNSRYSNNYGVAWQVYTAPAGTYITYQAIEPDSNNTIEIHKDNYGSYASTSTGLIWYSEFNSDGEMIVNRTSSVSPTTVLYPYTVFPDNVSASESTVYTTTVTTNPSPIIKDNSELKFATFQDAKNHLNSLPTFSTSFVDKDGNLKTKNWVQVKLPLHGVEDDFELDDFVDEVDFENPDTVPNYLDSIIQLRDEQAQYSDYTKKPYSTEDEYSDEYTKPSPSDIVTTPSGIGGGSVTPSTGTGGGSPVIIPPIIPIGGGNSKLFSVYNPTDSEIDALGSYLWTSNIIELIAKMFTNNPLDAIISLHQIYITPPTEGRKNIKLGYLDSGVSADCVSEQYYKLNCGTVLVPEYYHDARDYSPWTQVQLYLPFIGIVSLTPEDIINSSVNVQYGVDIYTGSVLATVTVTKPDGATQTMYQYSGVSSVQYPLTGGSMTGMLNGLMRMSIGAVTGGVGGAVVGGLAGALSGGASVQRSGGFSSNSGAMGYKYPYLIINRKIPDDAIGYGSFYGLPANKTTQLYYCSGYTRVKSVHVENIESATMQEKDEIEQLLKAGVIIK